MPLKEREQSPAPRRIELVLPGHASVGLLLVPLPRLLFKASGHHKVSILVASSSCSTIVGIAKALEVVGSNPTGLFSVYFPLLTCP